MELLIPATLGPELYTELGGHTPGEQPQGLLLAGEVEDDPGVFTALECPCQRHIKNCRQSLEL